MPPHTPFVLLTTQRSGSSWLVDLIDSHPAARSYSEIFIDQEIPDRPWTRGMLPSLSFREYRRAAGGLRPLSTFRYLDLVAAEAGPAEAVGFKLMYNHWRRYPELTLAFRRRGYRVVHLVRRNAFDAFLSGLRSRRTGVPHAVGEAETEPVRLHVDVAECLRFVGRRARSVERMRRLLSLLRLPNLEVEYETLRDEPERELARIAVFLRLPHHAWSSRFRKIIGQGHAELVDNYPEVRRALVAAGYGEYVPEMGDSG